MIKDMTFIMYDIEMLVAKLIYIYIYIYIMSSILLESLGLKGKSNATMAGSGTDSDFRVIKLTQLKAS